MKAAVGPNADALKRSSTADLGERFFGLIDDAVYPCVGAKSALAHGAIETHEFGTLGDRHNDQRLVDGLSRFVAMIESDTSDNSIVHSYVAIFHGPDDMNEIQFEAMLWAQLWRAHRLDALAGHRYAHDVSNDSDSPLFCLSVAGHPFFVIGLHAHASRLARRFSHPVLVFNSHRQFEKLREDGRYWKMQKATRVRDVALQGSINPNLADFGEASEARQYSGRKVGAGWQCPVKFKERP